MKFSPLPRITHNQYLVAWCLSFPNTPRLSGRAIHAMLKRHGESLSEPNFHQIMSRLRSAGFVESEILPGAGRRKSLASRFYWLTPTGRDEYRKTRDFYLDHQEHPARFLCASSGVAVLPFDDWNGDRALKENVPGADATDA